MPFSSTIHLANSYNKRKQRRIVEHVVAFNAQDDQRSVTDCFAKPLPEQALVLTLRSITSPGDQPHR